jgi:hypothetical protein
MDVANARHAPAGAPRAWRSAVRRGAWGHGPRFLDRAAGSAARPGHPTGDRLAGCLTSQADGPLVATVWERRCRKPPPGGPRGRRGQDLSGRARPVSPYAPGTDRPARNHGSSLGSPAQRKSPFRPPGGAGPAPARQTPPGARQSCIGIGPGQPGPIEMGARPNPGHAAHPSHSREDGASRKTLARCPLWAEGQGWPRPALTTPGSKPPAVGPLAARGPVGGLGGSGRASGLSEPWGPAGPPGTGVRFANREWLEETRFRGPAGQPALPPGRKPLREGIRVQTVAPSVKVRTLKGSHTREGAGKGCCIWNAHSTMIEHILFRYSAHRINRNYTNAFHFLICQRVKTENGKVFEQDRHPPRFFAPPTIPGYWRMLKAHTHGPDP